MSVSGPTVGSVAEQLGKQVWAESGLGPDQRLADIHPSSPPGSWPGRVSPSARIRRSIIRTLSPGGSGPRSSGSLPPGMPGQARS